MQEYDQTKLEGNNSKSSDKLENSFSTNTVTVNVENKSELKEDIFVSNGDKPMSYSSNGQQNQTKQQSNKSWREQIRVRQREEKKKKIIEVRNIEILIEILT